MNKSLNANKKQSHINVVNDDPSGNPHCLSHGPSIQMSESFDDGSPTQMFFACSANRDRFKCKIQTGKDPIDQLALQKKYEQRLSKHSSLLAKIKSSLPDQRGYCGQCSCLVLAHQFQKHRQHQAFRQGLTDQMIRCPTQILAPLDNDTKEAQYFFSEQSLDCFGDMFRRLGLR